MAEIITRADSTHWRSVAKSVSWRTIGSIDTLVLSYLFTGSIKIAGSIASTEVLTKMILYYFHERIWAHLKWGRK